MPEASGRLRSLVTALPAIDVPPQLVHGDFRASNILTARSRVTAVLDFDEVGLDYRVFDLAHATVLLATWFTSWRPTRRAARQALLAG